MESKMVKYLLIAFIFFIGLTMGVSYQENEQATGLQQQLKQFEKDIQDPDNNFIPVNPYDDDNTSVTEYELKHNVFTVLAKDGEYVIKLILDAVFNKSGDFIKFVFGA